MDSEDEDETNTAAPRRQTRSQRLQRLHVQNEVETPRVQPQTQQKLHPPKGRRTEAAPALC